ncbi:hypothetical protein [Tranquillimonas alkanivorans]|uniref:Uncharacterized protein n=1 Tax=Tranquillimonas alkanivorans TaxID=441119 RepID=A0A1I5VSU0_9RHOB|nr:hypothetical protein [Tranquillimonas alkanivorans]SFQ10559.1 hypothetical protein SAMN04488047_13519 [Tranquillimonas alkanivorans]
MSRQTAPLTIDDYALSAVVSGRSLAATWRAEGPDLPGPSRWLAETLARLEAGRVFEQQDESMLDRMRDAVREALNDHRPGFGDSVFAGVEPDLFVVSPEDREREKLRELADDLMTFRGYRRAVLNRVTAERELRKLL